VLEGDEVGTLLGDEHIFGGPALVGRILLERRVEAHHFQEVEAHAVRSGHGEDRAPVALERREARLTQPRPGCVGAGSSVTGAPRVLAPRGFSAFSSSGQAKNKIDFVLAAATHSAKASKRRPTESFRHIE